MWADRDRKRENDLNKKSGDIEINVRRKFFPMRVVRHWNGCHREIVDVPCLEVFKARWDGALRKLVQWKLSLLMAGLL